MSKIFMTISVDHDISNLFKQKYRGRMSTMIETYMRECCDAVQMDSLNLEDQLNKAIAEQERNKILQATLRMQLREHESIQQKKNEEMIQKAKDADLEESNYSAMIRDIGKDVAFKFAKSKEPTLTAKQFYERVTQ